MKIELPSLFAALMAEVLGIVASAVTLFELTIKVSKALSLVRSACKDYSKTFHDVQGHMHSLASVCTSIKTLQMTLASQSNQALAVLQGTLNECGHCVEQLQALLHTLASEATDRKFQRVKKVLKSLSNEDEIQRCTRSVETARANLVLALSNLML